MAGQGDNIDAFGQLEAAIDRRLAVGRSGREREQAARMLVRDLAGGKPCDFANVLPTLQPIGAVPHHDPRTQRPHDLYAQLPESKQGELRDYHHDECEKLRKDFPRLFGN